MQFIANYDAKNIFGCFENVEQHALAFSEETAAKLFDSGMKIFRGDASTLNALKICFTGSFTICIYREIADSLSDSKKKYDVTADRDQVEQMKRQLERLQAVLNTLPLA